jgi:hypothetical protein
MAASRPGYRLLDHFFSSSMHGESAKRCERWRSRISGPNQAQIGDHKSSRLSLNYSITRAMSAL